MRKLMYLMPVLNLLMIFILRAQTVPIPQTIPNAINYTLPAHENVVSGGIYSNNILIRTLFSNQSQEAGTHTAYWDGRDDDGNLQTIGANYQLKVAYNNDAFVWKGVIGNTS